MKHLYLTLFFVAAGLPGCDGTGLSFEREFEAVQPGATRTEVIATIKTTPLIGESYNVGGFGVTRLEIADVKARYAFVLAATPLSEPRLIAKTRIPHSKCN